MEATRSYRAALFFRIWTTALPTGLLLAWSVSFAGQKTAYKLNAASYSAAEGGSVTVTVTRYPVTTTCTFDCDWFPTQPSTCSLWLDWTGHTYPIDCSDIGGGWVGCQTNVTIAANQTTATITIPFVQNSSVQYDRTRTLRVGSGLVDTNQIQDALLTLQDDDNPVYAAVYSGGNYYNGTYLVEGGTSGANTTTVRILRAYAEVQGRTISYTIGDSTASGSDYTASPSLSGSVTIPQGSDHADFTITALPDSLKEGDETLIVRLTGGAYHVEPDWTNATITILDDYPTVTVTTATNQLPEGYMMSVVFARDTYFTYGTNKTINFHVGGTATNGTDYTLASTATITGGQYYVSLPLTVLTDALLEGVEQLTVTLDPGVYVIGSSSNLTINLLDDYAIINVSASDNHAAEGGDTGTFNITRSGNLSRAITVQLNVTGTATPGVDYTSLPTTVTLPAGVSTTNLTVTPLVNDGAESAETVVLSVKSDPSYLLGLYTNAVVTITGEGPNPRDANGKAIRYMRGSGTNISNYSFVVPLDDLRGIRRNDIESLGYTPVYHYNATNTGNQAYATNRIAYNTPIVSFGVGLDNPLYIGQSYSLGLYQGAPTLDPIEIYVYRRSDLSWVTNLSIALPDLGDSADWSNFSTNGFARTVEGYGLKTVLRDASGMTWGTGTGGYLLTHTASDEATNYFYLIVAAGKMNNLWATIDAANQGAYGYFYELTFQTRPGWRSVFVDQPHFQSVPLPPDLWNRTPEELLNYGAVVTNTVSLSPSTCTNLDQSPELRRHPILDQFVSDLNNDPLALANYVQNEIQLVDPIAFRDDGQVQSESVNQGGVNRSALGVYLEGQGSPMEQCALLIYLLRQAGYPAVYVFPPDGGLKMLDKRLSALLRMRINDGQDSQGRLFTTNRLITANYPWVAAYVNNQWVHLFPWIKDTSVEEGLDIYDYLPDPYKDTQLWVRDYILNKTNITAFATLNDDTPSTVFPRYLDNALKQNAPGVSLDDIGMRYVNRRHLYAQWSDFPRPTLVTNSSTAVESLASTSITNVSATLTNVFDTLQIELYSVANPQSKIQTPPLRTADLHNRKFFLSHTNIGNGQIQATLTLGPFRPEATGQGNFSTSDTTLTNKQVLTLTLNSTDDSLKVRFRHRRQRALTWETALDPDRAFLDLYSERELLFERPLRKGDLAAICFDPGRVTPAMLRLHAQELWNMEQMLSTNALATNLVSADVYQGSLLYLMGMTYSERVARFDGECRRLFKVQIPSMFSIGLAKVSPRRNTDGTLYGGSVDPIWPNVDMFSQVVTVVGNGTARTDSGWDRTAAARNYNNLSVADRSAQEHVALNIFFGQSNSVSTVKLLQVAQNKVATGGSNVVELSYYNHLSAGYVPYNGTYLKDYDPNMWSEVVGMFEQSKGLGYVVGWMTPGKQTTPSGSFSGMAALILGVDHQAALIGDNQYGAYADPLAYNSLSGANTPLIEVRQDAGGNYYSSYSAPSANQRVPGSEVTTVFDLLSDYYSYNNTGYVPNPNQSLQGILDDLIQTGAYGAYQNSLQRTADSGLPSTKTDFRAGNGVLSQVEDPVNALTGEFYIDDVDLSLPGPMALQVRRNYGSQNLANNQLGFGWKLNYMPYLSVGNASNIVYEAEPDGSVLAFGPTGTDSWSPSLALNPTLNNNSANGIGSVANRLNARLTKVSSNYFLTGGDGSLRVFQEMSFPLTNSTSWDRFRPYLTYWYDNRSNFYRFEYGTNALQADYGQVRRIVSSSGNVLRFEYDAYGRIVDAYSLGGRRVQYDYDQHGDLVTVTRPDTSEIRYDYQLLTWSTNSVTSIYSTHLLLTETKPDGRVLKNEYDDQRRVTNQWSTVGPDLRLVRNASFRYTNDFKLTNLTATVGGSTTILDYTNNPTTYYYTNGLIRRVRDALGAELVQAWYEATETNAPAYPRSLKTITDKRGLVSSFYYDARGNLTNVTTRGDLLGDGNTNATAGTFTFYDTNNLPTKTVDASGTTNLYFYTNNWLLARTESWPSNALSSQAVTNLFTYANVTNAADGTVSYGLRVREIRAANSPDAATNEWTYNSLGFPISETRYTGTGDPAVIATNFYNTRGELAVRTDVAGRRAVFGYDPLGNLQSRETFDAGSSIPMSWDYLYYNENGELTWSDGPRYNPEDYVWRDYDGAGRQTQEIRWRSQAKSDGTGVEAVPGYDLYATTFLEYDPINNLTKVTDPRGNYVRKKYDTLGRMVREEFYDTSSALLSTNGFVYNAAGDVTNAFNALGGSVERQFTSAGKPKFQRNADGSTNSWRYYADGRLATNFLSNGAYWRMIYDDAARRKTRIFHSAAHVPLATNVTEFDRRGNTIRTVDAASNAFTNFFDGLERLKWTMGPRIVFTNPPGLPEIGDPPPPIQQASTNYYDAAGVWFTNVNALGEKSIERFDALGRVTRSELRDKNNALVRESGTAYSTDHHSVTSTNGSGSGAVILTAFTDNEGRAVLNVSYPYTGVREFTLRDYDATGNAIFAGRYAATNTSPLAFYSGALSDYDGLNRLRQRVDRDGAFTTFAYDALGNLTNRTLPGGVLQWQARYNNAGQLLEEKNVSGSQATRTNTYAYSSVTGLQTNHTDGRGVVCALTYDDFLRPMTNSYTGTSNEHNFKTVFRYDVRGLVTNVTESFSSPSTGPTTTVLRSFDPYGLLAGESVLVNGSAHSGASLARDSAGRRAQLAINHQLSAINYSYAWRADGLLAGVGTPSVNASYSYTTAGLLSSRTVNNLAVNVTSRDGAGRVLAQTSSVNSITRSSESLSWSGDGLLASHTITRTGDFTDARSYDYAGQSRRLAAERVNLDATKRWTNLFTFDSGVAGGPGVLTKVAEPQTGGAAWEASVDGFDRIERETNNVIRRMAYGRMNGPTAHRLDVSLDGRPLPINLFGTSDSYWPVQWRTVMELRPGTHTLLAVANHSSGRFTTNTAVTFTNNAVDTTTLSHFSEGQLSYRVWRNAAGQTNRVQTFTWDARSRLLATSELDANNNGYNLSAVYDGFGRRLQTTTVVVTNGLALTNQPRTISQVFDPSVEFLELAVEIGGKTTWKICGPDLDGRYGGMNGTGGLDGVVDDFGIFRAVVGDARGNLHGKFDSITNTMLWNASRPTGFGAVPEYRPVAFADNGDVVVSGAWNGRWSDLSGLIWLGERYYDPVSGSFISCDPYGHDGDPNLYAFCGGDPINFFDPDGRLGKKSDSYLSTFLGDISFGNGGTSIDTGGMHFFLPDGEGFDPLADYRGLIDPKEMAEDALLNKHAIQEAWQTVRHPDFRSGWGVAQFGVGTISLGANSIDAGVNMIPIVGTVKGFVEVGVKAGVKQIGKIFVKEVGEETVKVGVKDVTKELAETGIKEIGGGRLASLEGNIPNAKKWAAERGGSISYHPDGTMTYRLNGMEVKYSEIGYPDFSPYIYRGSGGLGEVRLDRLTGSRTLDEAAANAAAGFKDTPLGYTWHHNESVGLMQLVEEDVHATFPHRGGFSVNQRR